MTQEQEQMELRAELPVRILRATIAVPGVPYSQFRVYEGDTMSDVMAKLKVLADAYGKTFPEPERSPAPAPQQRTAPAQGRSGRRGETRADKYPVVHGMQCDECGGAVGRRPRTGRMSSDAAVCLGTCKDGEYVHTVAWLDEPAGDDPGVNELPF